MPEDREAKVAGSDQSIKGNNEFRATLRALSAEREDVPSVKEQEGSAPDQSENAEKGESRELAPQLTAEIEEATKLVAEAILEHNSIALAALDRVEQVIEGLDKRVDEIEDLDDRKDIMRRIHGLNDMSYNARGYVIPAKEAHPDIPQVTGDLNYLLVKGRERFEAGGHQYEFVDDVANAFNKLMEAQNNRSDALAGRLSDINLLLARTGTMLAEKGGLNPNVGEFRSMSNWLLDEALPDLRNGVSKEFIPSQQLMTNRLADQRLNLTSAVGRTFDARLT